MHDGTVYVIDKQGADLYALDAITGERRWVSDIGYILDSSLIAISDNAVYVAANRRIDAIEPSSGNLLWYATVPSTIKGIREADNVLYVRSPDHLYALAATGDAPDVDKSSGQPVGRLLWRHQSDTRVGTPTASDNSVYFYATNHLRSLNAGTGELQWKSEAPGGYVYFHRTNIGDMGPLIVGDILYTGSFIDHKDHIYGLDATNGEVVWSYFPDGDTGMVNSPAIANGVLYFGVWIRPSVFNFLSVNALSSGPPRWSTEIHSTVASIPVVVDGVAYVTTNGDLLAIDAITSELLWRLRAGRSYDSSALYNALPKPAVSDNVVYAALGNGLVALEPRSGNENWIYTTGDLVFAPIVHEGSVYLGSHDNHLYALDSETGKLLWKYDSGDWVETTPAISDGVIYFGSYNARFFALDATSGELLWTYKLKESVRRSPAVLEDTVYIGTKNYLYALRAPGN